MRILICGANGFIGSAIAEYLVHVGHTVYRGVRRISQPNDIAIDYSRDLAAVDWLPRLAGIDVVINAVGIMVESAGNTFEHLHRQAPCALFAACEAAGVKRVIQISALGAENCSTPYFASKYAADQFLQSLNIEWQILRPGLIYGADGGSARLFRMLASIPVAILPGDGEQRLQPIDIDDFAEAVSKLIDTAVPPEQCVALVGNTQVSYREMLHVYRVAMGFPPALQVGVPTALVTVAAKIFGLIPGSLLTFDTWRMLQAGSSGDATVSAALLGRAPKGVANFISPRQRLAASELALSAWQVPLLRISLAIVWIVSAVVSVGVFPLSDSLNLLHRVGLTGSVAVLALYGSSAFDLLLGLATLFRPSRSLWLTQIGLIGVYSVIIAAALPEFYAHPFTPMVKNLPMVAILITLYARDSRA